MRLAGKLYVLEGLGFVLLTFVLLVLAATGPKATTSARLATAPSGEPVRYFEVQPPESQTLLMFLASMLALGVLGAALGLCQRELRLSPGLQVGGAVAYGLGVLGFVFLAYFNVLKASAGNGEAPVAVFTGTVSAAGLLLLLALGLNFLGFLFSPRSAEV